MPLTPEQCRAARGLLDWTQEHLAKQAGVSRSTIRGFESGRHELHRGSAAAIRRAFEAAGVLLLDPDGEHGLGVRFHEPRTRSTTSEGVDDEAASRRPDAKAAAHASGT